MVNLEKMFTYFYNKQACELHAVYKMWCKQFITHVILVAAEGLWQLRSLFYHDTQYSQWEWFTNLLCCDIPLNNALCTGPCHIWRTYTHCPFSGHEMSRDGSGVWWMILLASVGYGSSWVTQHLLQLHLVFQPIWEWGDLGFSSFFNQIPYQKEPEFLVGILASHEDNRIQLLSNLRSRRWTNNFVVHLKIFWLIE